MSYWCWQHSRFYTAAVRRARPSKSRRGSRERSTPTGRKRPNPRPTPTTQSGTSAEGGVSVGKAIARAELEPVDDSDTRGTAVLKEVGDLGVQVELEVSGLTQKDPDAAYYAQAHEGSCSDQRITDEEHEGGARRSPGSRTGPCKGRPAVAKAVAKAQRLEAHGGHEHIPEVPSDNIEQPISFVASADGTSSVTSLLEGVEAKRLTSGGPEYVHLLHAVGSEDAPELACGNLVVASRSLG